MSIVELKMEQPPDNWAKGHWWSVDHRRKGQHSTAFRTFAAGSGHISGSHSD